jgi:hypothetical protein
MRSLSATRMSLFPHNPTSDESRSKVATRSHEGRASVAPSRLLTRHPPRRNAGSILWLSLGNQTCGEGVGQSVGRSLSRCIACHARRSPESRRHQTSGRRGGMLRRGVLRAAAGVARQRMEKRSFAQAVKTAGAACPAKHEHDAGRTSAQLLWRWGWTRCTDGRRCSQLLEVPPRDGLLLFLLQELQRHPAGGQGRLPLRLL